MMRAAPAALALAFCAGVRALARATGRRRCDDGGAGGRVSVRRRLHRRWSQAVGEARPAGRDHHDRRHRLDQRGDFRQRRVRADFRAVADAGGGERPAPAGDRQHHRQADHRDHHPQGHRRRRRASTRRRRWRNARRFSRATALRSAASTPWCTPICGSSRWPAGSIPRASASRRWPATTCSPPCRPRRSTACRRCCRGRARARSKAPRCWSRAAPKAIRRTCRRSPSTWWRPSPTPARSANRCARRWARAFKEAMAFIRSDAKGTLAILKQTFAKFDDAVLADAIEVVRKATPASPAVTADRAGQCRELQRRGEADEGRRQAEELRRAVHGCVREVSHAARRVSSVSAR